MHAQAVWVLVGAAMLWSLGGLLIKWVDWHPLAIASARSAIFLQYTAPVYIALLGAWFLHEKPSRLDWLLIGVAVVGVGLFFVDQLTPTSLWGNGVALASGLSFAGLAVLLRKQKDGSPADSVLLGNLLTARAATSGVASSPS